MRKIALPFLLLPLAACSGGGNQQTAITACETALSALIDDSAKIEKLTVQDERVHGFVSGKNGLGEVIYKDLYCVFTLGRELTERDATYKLTAFAEDDVKHEFGIGLVDFGPGQGGQANGVRQAEGKGLRRAEAGRIRPEARVTLPHLPRT